MSDFSLIKIRFQGGVWEGRITGSASGRSPDINVLHLDKPIEGVGVTETDEPGNWELKISVPAEAISEGVQTFLITEGGNETALGEFTIIAGEAAVDDLRAEVDLLRAELDMLKRAFRRHCLETM